ncbi:MAG: LemA family protein, partial [Chloroflexi bacterium]|nr:LemA family protein [Chloroflexota bacterium]
MLVIVIILAVLLVAVLLMGLMMLGIYNGLIRSRVRTREAWA